MSERILSPDGKFLWTGEKWVPAPPGDVKSSNQTIIPHTDSSPQNHFKDPRSTRMIGKNSNELKENLQIKQSSDALRIATTVVGWNGVVIIAMIITAYTYVKANVEPEWIIANDYLVLKILVVTWGVGIILSIYSKVKSAVVQDEHKKEQIRIINKTSTVLLALPLLPIALIVLFAYLSMKNRNNKTIFN